MYINCLNPNIFDIINFYRGSSMIKAQSLDGLFEKLLDGKSIFKNKEVLRPSYTPDLLLHSADLWKNRNRKNGCHSLRWKGTWKSKWRQITFLLGCLYQLWSNRHTIPAPCKSCQTFWRRSSYDRVAYRSGLHEI